MIQINLTKKALNEKIDILLENSFIDSSSDYKNTIDGTLIHSDNESNELIVIEENIKNFIFINRQAICLKNLYSQLGQEKIIFIKILLREMKNNVNSSRAETAFKVLLHIKKFDQAFNIITRNFIRYNQENYKKYLVILSETLRYEWILFSEKQLINIDTWVNKIFEKKNDLGENLGQNYFHYYSKLIFKNLVSIHGKINKIRTEKVIKDIDSNFNPEINADEDTLKEKIKKYDFPSDLNETLEKIEQNINQAEDGFDFKGCMDLLRSFSESLYKTIAILLDKEQGEKMDEKDSKKVASFFKRYGLISADQGEILVALRHFLSNFASHRLKSKPQDARLSRNMTIEFSLYLIERLNEIKKH